MSQSVNITNSHFKCQLKLYFCKKNSLKFNVAQEARNVKNQNISFYLLCWKKQSMKSSLGQNRKHTLKKSSQPFQFFFVISPLLAFHIISPYPSKYSSHPFQFFFFISPDFAFCVISRYPIVVRSNWVALWTIENKNKQLHVCAQRNREGCHTPKKISLKTKDHRKNNQCTLANTPTPTVWNSNLIC